MLTIRDAGILSTSYHPRTQPVDTLVLHYTELNLDESLRILRSGGVSAHFVLAEDGVVYALLPHNQVAWHAGLSTWRDQPSVNARSIGIEIVNRNGNRYPYPEAQIDALIELCRKIIAENPAITPGNIVGHSDIAPRRKVDPGRFFPWRLLADAGIGIWPYDARPEPVGSKNEIRLLLKACGYPQEHAYGRKDGGFVYLSDPENPPIGVNDIVKLTLRDIVTAFQLRYEPDHATGIVTEITMGLLRKVSSLIVEEQP
jgi:N-acetyl-anhydromuramyl-L-alanine amidase AmpD